MSDKTLQEILAGISSYAAPKPNYDPLEEGVEYEAIIVEAVEEVSKAGNEMFVLDFKLVGRPRTIKAWYVKSQDWALNTFVELATFAVGPEAMTRPLPELLGAMYGMRTLVTVKEYTNSKGFVAHKIHTVKGHA